MSDESVAFTLMYHDFFFVHLIQAFPSSRPRSDVHGTPLSLPRRLVPQCRFTTHST